MICPFKVTVALKLGVVPQKRSKDEIFLITDLVEAKCFELTENFDTDLIAEKNIAFLLIYMMDKIGYSFFFKAFSDVLFLLERKGVKYQSTQPLLQFINMVDKYFHKLSR